MSYKYYRYKSDYRRLKQPKFPENLMLMGIIFIIAYYILKAIIGF